MNDKTLQPEVNGYQLLELIGSGGMSKVWRAENLQNAAEVAIKIIPIEDLASDFERRLRREPEIHQNLQHENIVALLDWFREGDNFYLVMEYVPGVSLSKIIRDSGPLDFNRTRKIMRDILRAVHHLHMNDVLHRDIKPGNILIAPDRRAKLTDFGIAKFSWQQGETRTQKGLGTPEYMSPEQVRGRAIDYRTDIWSLGVTLFEMLTGRKPFSRSEETPAHYAEAIGKIMNEDVPDPRSFAPSVPDDAIKIIRKAMAKNPADRFGSCAELLGTLETVDETKVTPFVDPDATLVLQNSAVQPLGQIPSLPAPPPRSAAEGGPEVKESGSSRTGLILALVLLLLAAGGYFGYTWYDQYQGEKQKEPLTKERAFEISRELAGDYKRFAYDGNVPALTTLYATEGVSYFRFRNVGRELIGKDYANYFARIERTDRLEVTVNRVDVKDDSTLTTQWVLAYERLKDDGTILRGEAVHDLTIRRFGGDWLILREKQQAIRRDNQAPPPPDTTVVDTTEVEEEPVVEEDEPKLPSNREIRDAIDAILVLINNEKSDQAWRQYASDELKEISNGFPAELAEGSLSIRNVTVSRGEATAILVKSAGFTQNELTVRFGFAPGDELELNRVTLSE